MALELNKLPFLTDANLQGYYRFELNIDDTTPNARNLIYYGAAPGYSDGVFGAAYDKVNNNDFLYVNNAMGVDGGAITIGCWFKEVATQTTKDSGIVCQVNINTDTRYAILRQNTNLVFMRDGIGGGGTAGRVILTWATYISVTKFSHLVLTYDNTNVKAYIDGEYIGQAAASGNGAGYAGSVTGFGVGAIEGWNGWAGTGGPYCSNGIYDDVFIMNRAMTADEIYELYYGVLLENRVYRRTRLPGAVTG